MLQSGGRKKCRRIILCNLSYFIIQLYQEITGIKGKGYVKIDISLLTREEREGGMFPVILLLLWIGLPSASPKIEGDC